MKPFAQTLTLLATLFLQTFAHACIWDGDTLTDEKKARPKMADAILGNAPDLGDPVKLRKRIAELNANRRDKDPAWWNELAGAHIRLGEPKQAVALLKTNVARFPNDYGIHANLGTAYHLLGRYTEAEKHIARDLEINPDAHFGLEKYHLALLQYLIRDAKYQSRHVYVDEFTLALIHASGPHLFAPDEDSFVKSAKRDYSGGLAEAENVFAKVSKRRSEDAEYDKQEVLTAVVCLDLKPKYRDKWNLMGDPKLNDGLIYMASLNPKEPACFTMLGVVCWGNGDLNLAAAAFEKAIAFGSPQANLLRAKISGLKDHIRESQKIRGVPAVKEADPAAVPKTKKR